MITDNETNETCETNETVQTLRNERKQMTSSELAPSAAADGGDIVKWQGEETGLEDFDSSDMSMPRLNIDHIQGVFKNSQTGDEFTELTCILLGLHKSRILWGDLPDGGDADAPLCKSPDMKNGFPNIDPDVGKDKRYPFYAQKVFKPADMEPLTLEDGLVTMPALPCAQCKFKEWNTSPDGKKPWCSEEWTFPLLYLDLDGSWVPALFTTRRVGLKSAKAYASPFSAKKIPLFTAVTKITLDSNRRGNVQFQIPQYSRIGRTAEEAYDGYFDNWKSAQSFLKQYPLPRDEEEGELDPADESLESDDIQNNVIDAEVEDPWGAAPKAQAPEPEPEPEAEPEEEVFDTRGKVKQPTPPAEEQPPTSSSVTAARSPQPQAQPSAGYVEIGDDEEPPF